MASLVVIGNFDGVHRGHRAVLESAVDEARTHGLHPKLLTFDPHPAVVLGRRPPPLLTRLGRKRELVARISPEIEVVAERFDKGYASWSPERFCEHLANDLGAARVVVGQNFRFGKDRAGDLSQLTSKGAELGFSARYEELRGDASGTWSSSRVRAALARGDLADATNVLGRPHMLSGEVVHGKHLGRTLGFPTANLANVEEALVPSGIYAVVVDRAGADGHFVRGGALAKGAMSVGTNPTTDAGDPTIKVEVFLFDFDADLYGATLRVHVVERLRGEEKFEGVEPLVAQMKRDCEQAASLLATIAPDPTTGTFG